MEPAEGRAAAVVERALALRRLSGLEALEPELLTTLASRAQLRRHRAGEALAAGHDPRPALHLVLEGRVCAAGAAEESSVGAGGLVGDRPALAGALRASEDSLTLALPVEDLAELCEEHFGLLVVVMRAVARAALAKHRASLEPADREAEPAAPSDELDLGGRVSFLAGSPTFAGVRVHTLGQLAQDARPFLLRSAERLWSVGDTPQAIVVVMRGSLRCRSDAGEFTIGPRALAGLAEAVAASPRWYDAEADGEVRGLRLEVSAVFDAMEDDPDLAVDVLAALARSSALALGL
jgi:CRP-like cAMP-binding protein